MARRLITFEISVLIDDTETDSDAVRERLDRALYSVLIENELPDGKILSLDGFSETGDYAVERD